MPEGGEVAGCADALLEVAGGRPLRLGPYLLTSLRAHGKKLVGQTPLGETLVVAFGLHGYVLLGGSFPREAFPKEPVHEILAGDEVIAGCFSNRPVAGLELTLHQRDPWQEIPDLLRTPITTLTERVWRENRALGAVLVDQKVVAGIGKRLSELALEGTDPKQKASRTPAGTVETILHQAQDAALICRGNMKEALMSGTCTPAMWHTRHWV